MQPNTKGLKIQQLKVILLMQRGGEITVHRNYDKNTHEQHSCILNKKPCYYIPQMV